MSATVKHRRYKCPEDVRKHIDKVEDRAIKMLQEAEQCETTVRLLQRPPEVIANDIKQLAEKSRQLRERANKIIHTRIPKLSQKLAVIQTPILPGIPVDESIPQRASVQ